jgi:hypothetical protein
MRPGTPGPVRRMGEAGSKGAGAAFTGVGDSVNRNLRAPRQSKETPRGTPPILAGSIIPDEG